MSELDDIFNEFLNKKQIEEQKEENTKDDFPEEAKNTKSIKELKPATKAVVVEVVQTKQDEVVTKQAVEPRTVSNIFEIASKEDEEFDLNEEEEMEAKEVVLIYGHKGHGKTFLALTFDGEKYVLSFDRKTALVKKKHFPNDKTIHIFDVVKYMDYSSPEAWLKTSDKTFRYVNALIDKVICKKQPDWIIFDGLEILHQIVEMTMRYRNNLMPFQGIKNLNLWKERKMYLRQLHNKALNCVKKGIIYTTYIQKDEIIEDGEVVNKKDIPKWIDIVLFETDTVIKVVSKITESESMDKSFIAVVESSKGFLPTGLRADVTNKGYKGLLEALKLMKTMK